MTPSRKQPLRKSAIVLGALSALVCGVIAVPLDTAKSQLELLSKSSVNIIDRTAAVHSLNKNLTSDELRLAYEFLKNRQGVEERNPAGLRFLKNEAMTALRNQATPPAGLTELLANIYEDRLQDAAVRDYALQHLESWYEDGADDSPDAKNRVRSVLADASRDNSEFAGTALLGLQHIAEFDGSIDTEEINSSAVRLATLSSWPSVKVTALQICAERGCSVVLPVARALAQSSGDSALRISAISAVGRLGNASDYAVLQRLQGEQSEQLRPALAAALKKLEHKNQNAF